MYTFLLDLTHKMKEYSLAEKVYIELRGKILSNQLVPGTRLKEDTWAKKMDVSRVAIREALIRLLGESLLEKGERGGYFVKSMTKEDIKEIRELREVLELGAISLVCEKVTKQDLLKLEQICDDFANMFANGYYGGACEADVKFHETLFDIAGNNKLKTIYLGSNIPLFHFKIRRASPMNDYEKTESEHRKILDALKKGDSEAAKIVLQEHLRRGELETIDFDE